MKKHKGMDAQLFEAAKNRFQQIMEYTVLGNNTILGEEGDDKTPDEDPQAGPMPPQGGEGPMPPQEGGEGAPMGPDQMGGGPGQPPMPQPPTPQPQDAPESGPEGFAPQGDDIATNDFEGGEDVGPDDDVVDITDLTDAQENTEKEIGEIGAKFNAVLKSLNKFKAILDQNDAKIEDLKAEFERRNPTQVEKMSMNTAKGGPFTTSPEEYWDEKEKEGTYSRESDNNGKGMGQYTITANDLKADTDWKGIQDTFDDDFYENQTLQKILGVEE